MDLEIFEDERFDFEALDSRPKLGRRQFLIAGLATGAAATALPNYAAMARNRRVPLAKSGTFRSESPRDSRIRREPSSGPSSAASSELRG